MRRRRRRKIQFWGISTESKEGERKKRERTGN